MNNRRILCQSVQIGLAGIVALAALASPGCNLLNQIASTATATVIPIKRLAATPTPTKTAGASKVVTPAPTQLPPSGSTLRLNAKSACRIAPTASAATVTTINADTSLPIVGQHKSWYLVQVNLPSSKYNQCWIDGASSAVVGAVASIPQIADPGDVPLYPQAGIPNTGKGLTGTPAAVKGSPIAPPTLVPTGTPPEDQDPLVTATPKLILTHIFVLPTKTPIRVIIIKPTIPIIVKPTDPIIIIKPTLPIIIIIKPTATP
jgi:hypothetical protein